MLRCRLRRCRLSLMACRRGRAIFGLTDTGVTKAAATCGTRAVGRNHHVPMRAMWLLGGRKKGTSTRSMMVIGNSFVVWGNTRIEGLGFVS